ncbi:hypothetical protein RFM41_24120 [Mesorhizobium sp. VK25A]|uniref:Uncharacterized protein n=1 Tax=Mesorhizobium vachelliae TaxID=3072309 RepID=A0ABU5ADK7_9HYPH|nr:MULTISPECIES: hypothetical protein [unclassified Mesorhizobium]MDX8535355.1 hypothetical protein [Mesorhizobium sp. VK25D]MDX8546855.1 hypothetical protein [Mesorhizobium sp. VK25A]
MSAPDPVALQSEPTPQREQTLVPDVRPADLPSPAEAGFAKAGHRPRPV